MRLSKRLDRIPPYLFVEVDRKIAEKEAAGVDVISFGVGDPDLPTPESVIETLMAESRKPEHHRYPSYFGLAGFRKAAARWFEQRFGVELDPDRELLPLIGSKEGIAHLAFALLDPGYLALVPEPAYPVYEMGTILAGAEPHFMPLKRENAFLPDLRSVPEEVAVRAKVLWFNYPNNPTGAVAGEPLFEEAIEFAKRHEIVLAHDNAYSEITYDGLVAPSLLEFRGGMDVGIEFHSLSKSFNMAGWRIGFACGNAQVIQALGTVKTNIDSGIFNPIQLAGKTALEEEAETSSRMRDIYQSRRDYLVNELSGLGWEITPPGGSIYVWMPVPSGFDSMGFSTNVLDRAGIFFTPGNAYGPSGEGYVRISLSVPIDRMEAAVLRLKEAFPS
jgi:LL-diaminopimelate aminotransferase